MAAGTTNFDVNARFPAAIKFTGLHIHNGPAGVAAGVTIATDLGSNNVSSDTGNVNISKWVTSGDTAGATTLNNLLANPSTAYVNLHTTDNPGGAVRAQLGVARRRGLSSPFTDRASRRLRRTLAACRPSSRRCRTV